MRSDPKLTAGINVYWIKFFLVAVYATMYVRDHARPEFHKALGVDIDWYDDRVLRMTTEISRQVFPIEIDHDNPKWMIGLKRVKKAMLAYGTAKQSKSFLGALKRPFAALNLGLAFVRLYAIPAKKNAVPETSRLQPSY